MTRQRGLRRLLRKLLLESEKEPAPVSTLSRKVAAPQTVTEPPEDTPGEAEVGFPDEGGEDYLERLRAKMERTARDFAAGLLNRAQFEELYAHYQAERANVEFLLHTYPETDEWKSAVTEGHSMAIRRRHQARVVAYSIYDNDTSLPLYTFGDFKMESELVVGMLSGFRSASAEILGSGLRKTEVEDGKALHFVPGRYTTLVALYSSDPSPIQLTALEDVHRDFETANAEILERGGAEAWQLVFPHRPVLE
jgi:hypothetical protein